MAPSVAQQLCRPEHPSSQVSGFLWWMFFKELDNPWSPPRQVLQNRHLSGSLESPPDSTWPESSSGSSDSGPSSVKWVVSLLYIQIPLRIYWRQRLDYGWYLMSSDHKDGSLSLQYRTPRKCTSSLLWDPISSSHLLGRGCMLNTQKLVSSWHWVLSHTRLWSNGVLSPRVFVGLRLIKYAAVDRASA